jgi:AraC family transcriptional regulator of adaptative response/methylated-DNA-[protein]-cysteine methyltransferase
VNSKTPSVAAALTKAKVAPLDADSAWQQVLERDPQAAFFYAVTTTGVFCRPACKSRRALRANVRFFASAEAAQLAGFRPCLRCRPDRLAPEKCVERLCATMEANPDRCISLAELGRLVDLSPFTVQKLFKKQMGVSPLGYQRALRAARLRQSLKEGDTVTNAIYESGFSTASRAYEGAALGMTPSRFAQGGRGEHIGFTTSNTPFGWLIVAATERGLCWLALGGSDEEAEASLRNEFPAAEISRDPGLVHWVEAALDFVLSDGGESRVLKGHDLSRAVSDSKKPRALAPEGSTFRTLKIHNELLGQQQSPKKPAAQQVLQMDLRGTAFQLRVWQALREIPRGQTLSYSQLARQLGNANATRAVARACASNRVALLVPCHRVVGASGSLTGYRWGVERKRQLLEAERRQNI